MVFVHETLMWLEVEGWTLAHGPFELICGLLVLALYLNSNGYHAYKIRCS